MLAERRVTDRSALRRPLCTITDSSNCGSENCSNRWHGVTIMPEGSNELSSRSRRDHSSICYLSVLTLAGETFGKFPVTADEMFPILRRP